MPMASAIDARLTFGSMLEPETAERSSLPPPKSRIAIFAIVAVLVLGGVIGTVATMTRTRLSDCTQSAVDADKRTKACTAICNTKGDKGAPEACAALGTLLLGNGKKADVTEARRVLAEACEGKG